MLPNMRSSADQMDVRYSAFPFSFCSNPPGMQKMCRTKWNKIDKYNVFVVVRAVEIRVAV